MSMTAVGSIEGRSSPKSNNGILLDFAIPNNTGHARQAPYGKRSIHPAAVYSIIEGQFNLTTLTGQKITEVPNLCKTVWDGFEEAGIRFMAVK